MPTTSAPPRPPRHFALRHPHFAIRCVDAVTGIPDTAGVQTSMFSAQRPGCPGGSRFSRSGSLCGATPLHRQHRCVYLCVGAFDQATRHPNTDKTGLCTFALSLRRLAAETSVGQSGIDRIHSFGVVYGVYHEEGTVLPAAEGVYFSRAGLARPFQAVECTNSNSRAIRW